MNLIRLYPEPSVPVPPKGIYLVDSLYRLGTVSRSFVYGNFVQSMDGRIALNDASGHAQIPKSLTGARDWRLFQELQAHADCLITHGGYLRALKNKQHGDILQIGLNPDSRDLLAWRKAQGLPEQPAVVIASASLDFEIPESLERSGQPVYIATGANASKDRIAHWRGRGYEVILCGDEEYVQGRPLVDTLASRGYRCLYLIAGPRMLTTMLTDGVLTRLYLTLSHQILGGLSFHTLTHGPALSNPVHLALRSLYYGPANGDESGEWFAMFEPRSGGPPPSKTSSS